jgi:Family of unknown function (DUF6226)
MIIVPNKRLQPTTTRAAEAVREQISMSWGPYGPGPYGPPPEAYSHVTNPERFRPLHTFMVELIGRLQAAFDVERLEGYGLDDKLESVNLVRPSIKLVPRDPRAAPILVSFTAFPGLRVRVGRWYVDAFPGCGCDACDETADGEAARLTQMVDDVTNGRFREAIWVPLEGDAWQEAEFWSPCGRSSSRTAVDCCHARQLLAGSDCLRLEWRPWPREEKADRAHPV